MTDIDQLIVEYFQQMRENIHETDHNEYTHSRVALIKEYLEKPSHEQYWLILFERHWQNDRNNS
jgi:hypothetical protein